MADNVAVTEGAGTSIAADDISSVLYQRVKMVIGADGTNDGDIAATNPMPVSAAYNVVTVTCSLPTGALTSGDVMFDTQEIAGAVQLSGGVSILQSVTVLDKDDQGIAFDLVFLDAATSIGTEDSAVSISDANAEDILGAVSIVAGDYVDLISSQVATKTGIGLEMKADASTSLYVAGITRGAPTYSAAGVIIKFAFLI